MAEKKSGQQQIPSNWTPDGVSKGQSTGPVRPTPDAYNSRKGKG